ncbi:MAG: hypothetical protein HW417_1717 [Steroidobacteraceae bacterium]|nr:hypothetical protein [Steroidobacteraceae bacterium]
MDLSETILASMIGAAATMLAAMFQLFLAFRNRAKVETRPKRSTMRPLVAVFAMLIASAVGGFAYSELRAERVREDTRELREELTSQLQALALSMAKLELLGDKRVEQLGLGTLATGSAPDQSIESTVRVAACHPDSPAVGNEPVSCGESDATQIELCADVPASANVTAIELYARSEQSADAWDKSGVAVDQDFGGGRFVASTFTYPPNSVVRAVCTKLAHWNAENGHVARMIVRYTFAPPLVASQVTITARP